jgi:hypothetical protein
VLLSAVGAAWNKSGKKKKESRGKEDGEGGPGDDAANGDANMDSPGEASQQNGSPGDNWLYDAQ